MNSLYCIVVVVLVVYFITTQQQQEKKKFSIENTYYEIEIERLNYLLKVVDFSRVINLYVLTNIFIGMCVFKHV